MCTFCEKIYSNKDCHDIVFALGKYSELKYDPIERFITIDEDGIYDLNVIPDDPYELGFFPDVKFCPYCGRNLAENAEQEPTNIKLMLMEANINGYNQGLKDFSKAVLDGIEELKRSPWATDKRGNGFEYLITEALDVVADLCVKQELYVRPQEPKTGHWIPIYQGDEIINYRCSECELGDTNGSTNFYGWDYCRKCGARMVEPQESER